MSRQAEIWPSFEQPPGPELVPGLPTRALTLWQPWAWLVSNGHKDIENRPQGFSFKSFRGDFWIHAGLKVDPESAKQAAAMAADLGITIPRLTGDDCFGCIIGRATITAIIPPGASGQYWHFKEQWGFKVTDARPVKPVRCRGLQGFWNVAPDVLAQLGSRP